MSLIQTVAKNVGGVEDYRLVDAVNIDGIVSNLPYLEEVVECILSRCAGRFDVYDSRCVVGVEWFKTGPSVDNTIGGLRV